MLMFSQQNSRIGGRIRSRPFAGITIEMGAQWVLAPPTGNLSDTSNPFNIIYQLARQCGLELRPDFVGSRGQIYYDRNGRNIGDRLQPVFERFSNVCSSLGPLAQRLNEEDPEGNVDISMEVGLRLNGWIPRTPEEQYVEWDSFDEVVALPPEVVSFRRTFPFCNAGAIPRFLVTDPRGYIHLLDCLGEDFLSDSRLHLNARVVGIQWSDECVCATAVENGENQQYCARYAIHTFPVGSIHFGNVQFEPELTETKTFAFSQLSMAPFLKIWISFNGTFWDTDVDEIGYVDDILGREYYPRFTPLGNSYPGNPPILEAFLTGETGLRVAQQDPEITKQQIVEVLRRIYGDRVTEPVDITLHDFITSPFYNGNFARSLVGVNAETFENILTPAGRLYFTGEATNARFMANLQGGYFSGLGTASAILQDIREGNCIIIL